jgi:hypothetical protein
MVCGQVRVRIRVRDLARYPFGAISLEGEPRQGRVGRNNVEIIPLVRRGAWGWHL